MCFQDYFLSWARRRTLTRLQAPASLCFMFGENLKKQARNGTKRFAYLPWMLCNISPKNQHKCHSVWALCHACPSILRSLVSPTTHKRAGRGPCSWSMAKALHRSNTSCTLRLWITAEENFWMRGKTSSFNPQQVRRQVENCAASLSYLCGSLQFPQGTLSLPSLSMQQLRNQRWR